MIKVILLNIFLLFGSSDSVIDELQKTYENINFIKADFNQISESSSVLKGKFYFSKENNYRIELPNNIIISDGVSIWNQDIKRKRVVISNVEEDPLAFSLEQYIFEYPSKCKITEEKVEKGYLLFLDAADTDLKFKSAKLWITNNYLIEKILVVDFAGNLFTLQFSNISIPNRLDDSLFTYNEPNYKVIDLR